MNLLFDWETLEDMDKMVILASTQKAYPVIKNAYPKRECLMENLT
jgi:hypothetical protein